MWQWLKDLWYIGGPPLPGEDEPYVPPEPYRSSDAPTNVSSMPGPLGQDPTNDSPVGYECLKSILLKTAIESEQTRRSKLDKIFTSEKLQKAFINCMKYMAQDCYKIEDRTSVIGHRDVGLDEDEFPTFCAIFVKACNEIGLKVSYPTKFLHVEKLDVRNFLGGLPNLPKIDIDEKVRAMLAADITK